MILRKSCQWLRYRFLEGIFFVFIGLRKSLPFHCFRRFSMPLLRLLIYVLVPKGRIMKNLGAAFGEAYSSATKKGLAKGIQEHFAKNLVDCFQQVHQPESVRRMVKVDGLENLQAALAKGKGVIALGAHIGNFVLAGARLGVEGYPLSTLFRVPPEDKMKAIIERYRPYFHQKIIPSRPRRPAVRRVLGALKKNEIVFILGDNLKKGKIQSFLFGQPVFCPRGPVSLALRTGAPVVPLYLIRNYEGGLHLIIEPEIPLRRNGNLLSDISHNTHVIVRYLEDLIKRYPDQWSWLTVRMKGLTV